MKIFMINTAVFCTLWVFIHISLIAGDQILDAMDSGGSKSTLPNYQGHDWAAKHFTEFSDQNYQYRSFLGWRRYPYSGETINIDDRGVRRTVDQTPNDAKKTIFFFGGSTTWGTGVSDEFTIPSQFASMTDDYRAVNYGEAAWNAHQSLEMLIKLLQEGERPDIVVFYDGVNDVKYKCRTKHSWYSHSWEDRYVPRFELYDSVFSFDYVLGPLRMLANGIKSKFKGMFGGEVETTYNCHMDQEKAERIAAALVQDWTIAQLVVESYGGRFYAFLQPVSYFSETKLDRIHQSEQLRGQFELIYPMIRRGAEGLRGFHDLTDLFDRDEYIYVDYAHVSPNGNEYAAERILSIVDEQAGGQATN